MNKIVFEKWHWHWYFKDKMILNGQNNVRNELYMSALVDLDLLHLFLLLTMAKLWPTVFGIAKWPWPWPFEVQITQNGQNNIRNEFPTPQLVQIEVLHVHIHPETEKLDFHHSRWQPYLIWPLRHSCHYGGRAPQWFFMSRDPLTQFRWETPLTPNCEQDFKPDTVLLVFLTKLSIYRT